MSQSETPTDATIIRQFIDDALGDVRVALPGRVETYDVAAQSVDVKPLIKDGVLNEDEERIVESLPVIPSVPLVFPGSGGFAITWPIDVGDTVLLVFSSSSIDKWLVTDGDVDPDTDHRHRLDDAIAIPGLRSFKSPINPAPGSNMEIRAPAGVQILVGGTSALALVAELNSLIGKFNTHSHTGVTTGGGISGPPQVGDLEGTASGTQVLKGS